MDEGNLGPLLVLGELVAALAGGKAALGREAEVLKRHVLGGLVDALNEELLILKTRLLAGHKAEHDFLALGNVRKWLEAAGSRGIKLQVEGIDVLVGKQVGRNGLVAALKGVGGVVVATADVRVYHKVGRLALKRRVVERYAQLGDLLYVHGLHAGLGHKVAVAVDAPRAVVKLDVSAAGGVEVGQYGAVGGRDVGDELLVGRIDGAQALYLPVAAVEDDLGVGLHGRRDGLAGNLPLLKGLHKLEVLNKRVVLAGDLASHDGRVRSGLLVVEEVTLARSATLDAVQSPHEVKVPVAAAELAVGDDVEARCLLLGHEVADGLVLHGRKAGRVNGAGSVVCAGLLEHVRAQEAADDVGAEGGVLGVGHGGSSRLVCLTRRESGRGPNYRELPTIYT